MCRVLWVTLGHHRITIGHLLFYSFILLSWSKHKANTTELHPKVRPTCSFFETNFQKHTLPLFLFQVPGHLQIIISLLYSPLKFYYMINSPCFPDRKGAGNIKLSIMTFTTGIRPLLLQLTMKWLPPYNGLSSQLSEK